MNEELFFIRLRDCFTAGYTFPQFCADNNIKKPLFIARDELSVPFVWEVYVQFKFAKSITPKFFLLNGKIGKINWNSADIVPELIFESVAAQNFNNYDKVIILIAGRINAQIPNAIYLDALTNYFIARAYMEIPILHFLQRHPKVKLIVTNFPRQPQIDDPEFQKHFRTIKDVYEQIQASPNVHVKNHFDKLGYNNQDALVLLSGPKVKINSDGSTYMEDDLNPLIMVKNGKRMTADQPENFVNKIYFIGTCHQYGINAPFDKTIESYLQKMLNDNKLPYRVENASQRYWARYQDLFYNLSKLAPKPNDIIFIFVDNLLPVTQGLPFLDTSRAFDNYDPRELWVVQGHVNEKAYKILAEGYFRLLVQNKFFKGVEFKYPAPPPPPHRYGIPQENFSAANLTDNAGLIAYKKNLRERKIPIGAIVMNCNPFTFGHKNLIEYAAARVRKLYIFVVEEDKSELKFADRFKLVQAGVKEFPNVEVIPSGQFIISQKTFSGYFNKENLQEVSVDSTQDVEIFAREIAPTLGINIRFVGAEPEDSVTRQYNENMKNILPRYGIDFVEIPRKEINGEVISAKSVRAALKVRNFDKIKSLVPKSTLDFLIENYSTPPHCRLTLIKFIGGIFKWLAGLNYEKYCRRNYYARSKK